MGSLVSESSTLWSEREWRSQIRRIRSSDIALLETTLRSVEQSRLLRWLIVVVAGPTLSLAAEASSPDSGTTITASGEQ